ncbi:HSF-type DNA-binding-domain-containing protein, partial [Vararia minispora EC-137]
PQEEGMPPTSDFVKKLYKMLEDQSCQNIVSWGPHGDCFVVKDMNEFTKSILPRMFKHSNFASFVRQLNKYDFHKVKNTDDNAFGEHSWTFRHPDFHADRRDALENIKRKVPAARKSGGGSGGLLQAQVDRLTAQQDEMAARMRALEANHQQVVGQLVQFQQDMAKQDGITRLLIQFYMQGNNNADVARASLFQMNEISRRAEAAGLSFADALQQPPPPPPPPRDAEDRPPSPHVRPPSSASRIFEAAAQLLAPPPPDRPLSRQDALARLTELQSQSQPQNQNPGALDAPFMMPAAEPYAAHEGLQVFTLGHLLPKSGEMAGNPFDLGHAAASSTTAAGGQPAMGSAQQTLTVRRSTFVPGWSVPPRVLLVEDDAVSRRLSSKFLQVFGCTTDVAVDGEGAVKMMNLAKYDLVLMDIVMPKLDGVTATSLIRQFDHKTPIISMTSNSKPTEIMTYMNSGMNDILPKPFTKEGLLQMLERHLVNFRQLAEMANAPRALGPAGALEDDGEAVLPSASTVAAAADAGKLDPLMALGLSAEQYNAIMGTIRADGAGAGAGVGGERAKRVREDDAERESKRGRFEELE